MTADINVILQLLQRQMAPVPPAYSAVSPGPHPPHPTTLFSTGAPLIHAVPPIQASHMDSTCSLLQVSKSPELFSLLLDWTTKMNSFFKNDLNGCLFARVQTLTSSTNPKTPSPVGSISPWPQMTPCPCLQSPTSRICPLWTSPPLAWQKSLPDCTAAASGSPLSPTTWSCPQSCRISRGIFLILSCLEARMLEYLSLQSVHSFSCCVFCSGAAVGHFAPPVSRFRQFVSYRLYSAPHRLLWFSVLGSPSRPANRTVVLDDQVGQRARKHVNLSCSCWIKSHIMLKRGKILKKLQIRTVTFKKRINVADVSSLPVSHLDDATLSLLMQRLSQE